MTYRGYSVLALASLVLLVSGLILGALGAGLRDPWLVAGAGTSLLGSIAAGILSVLDG